jgi:iron complex outermembrane receptor protein
VANYRNIMLGKRKLALNLAGNYTIKNEREGSIKNPSLVANAGPSVANATQEALFFTSRPMFKAILGGDYQLSTNAELVYIINLVKLTANILYIKYLKKANSYKLIAVSYLGKIGFSLNNTLFGPTKFNQQGLDESLYTEFKTKLVTDLAINIETTKNSTLSININNVFNVLPEWQFKANNSKGEGLLRDAAFLKVQSNLITFNQRYSQVTYDGYQFSQLGTLLNLNWRLRF